MATFVQEASYPTLARYGLKAMEWNGRLLFCGGYNGSTYYNDVWESDDGKQFNRICTGANSFIGRQYHALVNHDGKIFIIGGTSATPYNDVWWSHDARKWERIATVTNQNFQNRYGAAVWSYNGRIYIAGGYTGSAYLNDCWSSPDGVNWRQEVNNYSVLSRAYAGCCVYDNRMWISGGYNGSVLDTCYWSQDGMNWYDAKANLPALTNHTMTVFDNKMVVIGGETSGQRGAASTQLWYSYNGTEWVLGKSDIGFGVYDHAAACLSTGQRMYVLMGYNGSASVGTIWRTEGVEFQDQ